MKIIALEISDVKHLRVVSIKPDGSLVVIGGDNSQGKTCIFDSIEYALHGASSIPSKPIRTGQKKARIVLDLGDIQVIRTFTKKGTNLVVKNKKGTTYSSPQAVLNELTDELTFDPLEFSKMDAQKQADVLKKLVGINLDKPKAQYKKIFDQRTVVNRDGKAVKARIDSMTKHKDVPDKEVSIKELGAQYANAVEHNQRFVRDRDSLLTEKSELQNLEKRILELKKSIQQRKKALSKVEEIDDEAIRVKIAGAEDANKKVRENQTYDSTHIKLLELRKQSGSLTTQMAKILSDQEKALAKVKFPIEGLAIDDDGVTFEDIPFIQLSTSEQIRISVAIGLVMNPKLRILLIREGSLLDTKNLAMIAKMAEEADAQIWLERVSKGSECQVIIEDGEVLKTETVNA